MSIQRNVQQQNNIAFDVMLATASRYRAHGVNDAVRAFFTDHGIDIDSCAIVQAQEDYALGMEYGFGGLLVTQQGRFHAFELELDPARTRVVVAHEFEDTTGQQNLSDHNKGRGKGEGMLAMAVLTMLNHGLAPSPPRDWPQGAARARAREDRDAV